MVNTARTVGPLTAPNDRGGPPTTWHQSDWRTAERGGQRLRSRIFRAAKEPRWNQGRHLTQRRRRRYATVWVSVRRLTQVNRGRRTPGIDGEGVTTPEARAQRVDDRRSDPPWNAAPGRRVYLPKANGKPRPLGIPTRRDRVLQLVGNNALEPRCDAEFDAPSDGCRPGRCGQEAIEEVDGALNHGAVGQPHDILDADSPGAFDHRSQDCIRHRRGSMPGRALSTHWLKAG
jgi:RNA-directed DNA polymerase